MPDYIHVGDAVGCDIYRVEEGLYLVELAGHLSLGVVERLNEIVKRDCGNKPLAAVFVVTPAFVGYDHEFRAPAGFMLPNTVYIGLVGLNRVLRMVAATIAIGLKIAKNVTMTAHESVDEGIGAAREALQKARAKSG